MGVNSLSFPRDARKQAGPAYPFGYRLETAGESCSLTVLRAMTRRSAALVAHRYPSPRGRCGSSPDRTPASFLSEHGASVFGFAKRRADLRATASLSSRQRSGRSAGLRSAAQPDRRAGAHAGTKAKDVWNLHQFRGVEERLQLTEHREFPTCKTLFASSQSSGFLVSQPVRTRTFRAQASALAQATSSTAPRVVTAPSVLLSARPQAWSATTSPRSTATNHAQRRGELRRALTVTISKAAGASRSGGLFAAPSPVSTPASIPANTPDTLSAAPRACGQKTRQKTLRKGETCSTRS